MEVEDDDACMSNKFKKKLKKQTINNDITESD